MRLGEYVARALALATSGRPGPVHLSLPGDVLEAAVDGAAAPPAMTEQSPPSPAADELRGVVALLAEAKRPLVLVGPAMARGSRWTQAAGLARTIGAPALLVESPRGVNDPALRMAPARFAQADCVGLLGKPLVFSLRFGQSPPFAP